MRATPLSVSEISARLARNLCLREGRTPRHRFARLLPIKGLRSLSPNIFKPQILVPLFKNNNFLVRHPAAKESFSNVRSTANRIKTVCTVNAAAAKERKKHRKDRNNSFGFH